MPIDAAASVNASVPKVTVTIGPKKDVQNKSFTCVWQGLQNMGYSESEIYKIEKQLEKTTVNGKKYNARRIADGTIVDITDAIKNAGVKMPPFGNLTSKITDNKNVQPDKKAEKANLTYNDKPVNAEPILVAKKDAIKKYGNNKITALACDMTKINEADGSYLKTTHGKKQPWCADGVNYFYQQLLGQNPFTKDNNRNLSGVWQLQNWAQKNGLFAKAYEPETIAKQMEQIKTGDMIIFRTAHKILLANGKYHNVPSSHAAVVAGAKDGKILLMESNTNLYETDAKGRYYLDKNNDIKLSNAPDAIMLKEYGANELFSRGYTGFANMQDYIN